MPTGRPRAKTVYKQISALGKGGSAPITPPSSAHDLRMNAAIDPEGMAAVTTSLTAGSLMKGKMSSSLSCGHSPPLVLHRSLHLPYLERSSSTVPSCVPLKRNLEEKQGQDKLSPRHCNCS